MSPVRLGAAGATRVCPHCRQTILESASVCPACRHHLRFVPGEREERTPDGFSPLRVDGTISHPRHAAPWEYSVVVCVMDENGAELARHVVGVGVMRSLESRSFSLSVEVFEPGDPARS